MLFLFIHDNEAYFKSSEIFQKIFFGDQDIQETMAAFFECLN